MEIDFDPCQVMRMECLKVAQGDHRLETTAEILTRAAAYADFVANGLQDKIRPDAVEALTALCNHAP
jgi:hypothetical protein